MSTQTTERIIEANQIANCLRIYPTEEINCCDHCNPEIDRVSFRFTREEAVALARAILVVTFDFEEVAITGYYYERDDSDGTYPVTVKGIVPIQKGGESHDQLPRVEAIALARAVISTTYDWEEIANAAATRPTP